MHSIVPLTVIMPVFNAEKYLHQSIESILQQTFSDFEFLIFDDGSTDRSKDIIKEYERKDSRIKAIYSTINSGYVKHLNDGIRMATGEFIARMDSDDISFKRRFQIQLSYLRNHPSVCAVGSSTIKINSCGDELGLSQRNTNEGDLFWQSFFTNPLSHPTVVYRKEKVIAVGLYNSNKLPAEDYDLWTRLLTIGSIANINEPLVKYRIHESSISVLKRDTQLKNSTESLREHWCRFFELDFTNDQLVFLKNFHKGYDHVKTEDAIILFDRIKALKKFMNSYPPSFSQVTTHDYLKKQTYLLLKVRRLSFLKFAKETAYLLAENPITFFKFLVYGRK